MGRLGEWNSKVVTLNSTDGLSSGTQLHYEASGNLHTGDVVVSRPKMALGELVQIQVMDWLSEW